MTHNIFDEKAGRDRIVRKCFKLALYHGACKGCAYHEDFAKCDAVVKEVACIFQDPIKTAVWKQLILVEEYDNVNS